MRIEVVAFVLGGGVGNRLLPLTKDRAKPALPFGGSYRVIDFVLSNLIHSRIRKIYVLTQYEPRSLEQNILEAWTPIFGAGRYSMIRLLPAKEGHLPDPAPRLPPGGRGRRAWPDVSHDLRPG